MYFPSISLDFNRINYELKTQGAATVIVSSSATQDEIDDALHQLRSKYKFAEIDSDGDIVVSDR